MTILIVCMECHILSKKKGGWVAETCESVGESGVGLISDAVHGRSVGETVPRDVGGW
jgi:hypothetical protein